MQALLQNLMTEQHIPGLAIGVQRGQDLLHESYLGLANLEHHAPVQAETVFEIASVTKLFTTQAILRLVQEGRLTLDDRLITYLPDLPWKDVTIRHCLTHQSGIPNYTAVPRYWDITRQAKSHADILDLVRELPVSFPPGTRHSYDNTGFYLLGMLIEAVTQKSYATALQALIFEPLGMSSTRANNYEQVIPHRAQGYIYQEGVLQNKPFYDISNTFSAGVLLSTVRDLLTWRESLFNDVILNHELRQLWWTPHPSPAANERDFHYTLGLGWFMVGAPQFLGHNGSIAGFAATFMFMPDKDITAIVLCNAGHVTEPHHIALKVVQALEG